MGEPDSILLNGDITPFDPDMPVLGMPELPIRHGIMKRLPGDGRLVNVIVELSDEPRLDSVFAADGWEIIRAGAFSVRVKLKA